MDGSYPLTQGSVETGSGTSLRIWSELTSSVSYAMFGTPGRRIVPCDLAQLCQNPEPSQVARGLFACEAVRPPRGKGRDDFGEPYTLPWFNAIEYYRYNRNAQWLPRMLEFPKHSGETILCMGHGLGSDWTKYAESGSRVVINTPCPAQLDLIQRYFLLRKLDAKFVLSSPTALPLDNATIDIVCVNGLLEGATNPTHLVNEIYRVLKPGGKVIALTSAKYDVDFWADLLLLYRRWVWRQRPQGVLGHRFSGRRLRKLFPQFEEHRVKKRQLRRAEVPHLWRVVPLPILERVIGKVLVFKAFKPISVALPLGAAA